MTLGLEPQFFVTKIDKHISKLIVSNYPRPTAALANDQLRAGARTDYGTLTILLTEDKPGGLEVLCGDGLWRRVPIVPGAFVVTIGDLMATWTSDRWVSTIHRVANPPLDKLAESERRSIAFFHQPNYVDCFIGGTGRCFDE